MCPPVFWEEISQEERQSSLCFSPERPGFLRWSAETANLLSSKDSSCLKVTECLFHHFLHNAPYAARVRPNDEPFTALCVRSGVQWCAGNIGRKREIQKYVFHCPRICWERRRLKEEGNPCVFPLHCATLETVHVHSSRDSEPILWEAERRGGLWVMESVSGADSLYWCPMRAELETANFSNFRSVWTSSSPWKSVLVSSHCPVFFVWPVEVWL